MDGNKTFGLIADIQRYSVNDGPGTRTAVFFKGCPLRCEWCHNVEMISTSNEVWYDSALCTSCGKCIEICPESAIKKYGDERTINRRACKGENCLKCVEVCPTQAMTLIAQSLTIEEILEEVQKDQIFYWRDGGGITVSGGEPLAQPYFIRELLKECQNHAIHTVLDTCGFANWDLISKIAKYVDLTLFDIKHINVVKHKMATGVSNELILANARKLAKIAKMRIRVPVIPTFNDSLQEMKEIAEFIKSVNLDNVDLLPYHSYAERKYKMYMMKYKFAHVEPPSEKHMHDIKAVFDRYELRATIGG